MRKSEVLANLVSAGITREDATRLREIAMELHRWFELECGTSAGIIQQDETTGVWTRHDMTSRGYSEHGYEIQDREVKSKAKLLIIMARYPALRYYIQSDPRGAALYILRPGDIPPGENANAYYTRGIAVYR